MKKFRIGYQDGLLTAFLAGIAVGTLLVNAMSSTVRAGLGAFPFSGADEMRGEAGLFWYLFRNRAAWMVIGWLAGLTPYGTTFFLVGSGYLGVSMAVSLSMFTCQKGLLGPFWFLLTLLPHIPLYAVCWTALAVWAGKKQPRLRIGAMGCLIGLALIGAATETWGFPVLWEAAQGMT